MPTPEKKPNRSRLFIAYMLSASFQKKIHVWEQSKTFLPVKWTPLQNLHVTIIPPWYEERSKAIDMLTTNQPLIASFTLHFTEIGPGPTSYRPTLLWTTAEAAPQLSDLRSYFQQLLHISLEKRPFVPHVTVGKLFTSTSSPTNIPPFPTAFSHSEYISKIFLVESFLYQNGAKYKPLLTIPLT